ncbi:hypothetical protein SAMN02745119_03296 [Trichlorobacter thiogenes]|uniref:Glycosyltransferase n=1 Tax=Trichlorobacter thiogenes TaxID=115783 RepID=A0A1T4S6Y8_9BACT|nr:TIGR04282 family arsenosugar biosynthesis glycosyltransferase [Trichlorobacter thiogenes]SKA23917.1 hypothetical protein SAMN02745119_03296 [Trichlorobacter thiogenes]
MIALFVKAPIPGRVKTRLARDIGDQAACSIYRTLVDQVLQQIQASGRPLALFFDGDEAQVPDSWKQYARFCIQQQGADLGKRMAAALSKLFSDGVQQAVVIGSDIPGIDAAYLLQSFDLLKKHPLVLGPTLDGGYCLIGFNQSHFTESVFQNIPWSSDRVLELTLHAAAQAGLTVGLLPALRDIDTVEDLRYFDPAVIRLTDG